MKRPSANRLNSMLYTALVVVAATAILLLSRHAEQQAAMAPATPTPTVFVEAAKRTRFDTTPENVFLMLLSEETGFSVRPASNGERTLTLADNSAYDISATLLYTVADDDAVSSLTWMFPMRAKPGDNTGSAIEQRLQTAYGAYLTAHGNAMRAFIDGGVAAMDLNDALLEPKLLQWYTGALAARDEDKRYTDEYLGCTFDAYRTILDGEDMLICSLIA